MIIGSRGRFALEYEIREYYESDFLADGKFLVHIRGASFGQDRIDSTTFSGIVPRLGERAEKFVVSDLQFHDVESVSLAKRFYDLGYSDLPEKSESQRKEFNGAIAGNNIDWSAMDEAFDDGSYVLQINNLDHQVRLIGFRSVSQSPSVIRGVESITIPFLEFRDVVFGFIDALKNNFINQFGHGEELPVFNWWKDAKAQ